jgi:hypothetical protein
MSGAGFVPEEPHPGLPGILRSKRPPQSECSSFFLFVPRGYISTLSAGIVLAALIHDGVILGKLLEGTSPSVE